MSQSVQGSFSAGINLTTTFGTGTAGSATEVNNLGTTAVKVGPGQAVGQRFADCWSQTYPNVSAPFTIDVTNLTGIGSRIANFTSSGVRLLSVFNCDPNVGADFTIGPGASDGFAAPWDDSTATTTVCSGMPAAGVSASGQPTGNQMFRTNCTPAGWTVDATHKTLTITPVFSAITVTLSGGGGTGAVPGSATVSGGAITAIGTGTGGSGYTSAPTWTASGGGGIGASGTTTISGGAITGYTVTNGGSGFNLISNLTLIIAG